MKKLFHLLTEQRFYPLLEDLYEDKSKIDREARKRFLLPFPLIIIGGLLGIFLKSWVVFVVGCGLYLIYWKMYYFKLKNEAEIKEIKRQVVFMRYMDSLSSVLRQKKIEFTDALQQALKYVNGPEIEKPVYRFLNNITQHPNEFNSFRVFASEASGTDLAFTLCSTLYNFQQNSDDVTTITRLASIARKELYQGRKKIMKLKIKRFDYLAFAMFLGIMLPSFSYELVYMLNVGKQIIFHG